MKKSNTNWPKSKNVLFSAITTDTLGTIDREQTKKKQLFTTKKKNY